MIIVQTGWGVLVLLYGLAGVLVGGIIGNLAGLGARQLVAIGIGEVLAGVAIWFTGVRLNGNLLRQRIDAKAGKGVVPRARHALFGIAMQDWAPLLGAIGLIAIINGLRR